MQAFWDMMFCLWMSGCRLKHEGNAFFSQPNGTTAFLRTPKFSVPTERDLADSILLTAVTGGMCYRQKVSSQTGHRNYKQNQTKEVVIFRKAVRETATGSDPIQPLTFIVIDDNITR